MKAALITAALLFSGTALAEESTQGTPAKKDKLICVDQTPTGSRLNKKRVCMTQTEWTNYRRQMREDVEKGQMRQTNPQG